MWVTDEEDIKQRKAKCKLCGKNLNDTVGGGIRHIQCNKDKFFPNGAKTTKNNTRPSHITMRLTPHYRYFFVFTEKTLNIFG